MVGGLREDGQQMRSMSVGGVIEVFGTTKDVKGKRRVRLKLCCWWQNELESCGLTEVFYFLYLLGCGE